MARITVTVKRVTSLLKFLRNGRGLGKYRGGLEVVLHFSPQTAVGTLPVHHGGTEVSIDIPPERYGNAFVIWGSEPNQGDMIFRLNTIFNTTENGDLIGDPLLPEERPARRVAKLTIAVVQDWTDTLRRMQEELEKEAGADGGLSDTIESLGLRSFDRSFWQEFFAVPARSWFSDDLQEIVNCDHIIPRLSFLHDRIKADLDMRKPGGGRFGRARFDHMLVQRRSNSFVGGDIWQTTDRWSHAPFDIKFTRPGLNAVSSANQAALTELFTERFGEGSTEAVQAETLQDGTAIEELWPTLRNVAPPNRSPLLPERLWLQHPGFASKIRQRVNNAMVGEGWVTASCHRPRITSAIETLVTAPLALLHRPRRKS